MSAGAKNANSCLAEGLSVEKSRFWTAFLGKLTRLALRKMLVARYIRPIWREPEGRVETFWVLH